MSDRSKFLGTCTNCGDDIFVSRYSSKLTSWCAECAAAEVDCEAVEAERELEAEAKREKEEADNEEEKDAA